MFIAIADFCDGNNDYVTFALAAEGVETRIAHGVDEIVGADIAVLLIGAADPLFLRFIDDLRAALPAIPRVVVTDRDDVDVRLAAYEAGADECLSKPFHLRELMAKLRALKRRAVLASTLPLLPNARTTVDRAALELKFADHVRQLTKREADLLAILGRAGGNVVRRDDILREAWGAVRGVTENLVDVYVGYARRKLDDLGADVAITSVRGEGFRLVERHTARPARGRRRNHQATGESAKNS